MTAVPVNECRAGNSHCTATIVRQNRNNIGSCHHSFTITQRRIKVCRRCDITAQRPTAATLAAVPVNDVALETATVPPLPLFAKIETISAAAAAPLSLSVELKFVPVVTSLLAATAARLEPQCQ